MGKSGQNSSHPSHPLGTRLKSRLSAVKDIQEELVQAGEIHPAALHLAILENRWQRYIAFLEIAQGGLPHGLHRLDEATLAAEQAVGDLDHQRIWTNVVGTPPQQSCDLELSSGVLLHHEDSDRRR